MDASRASGEVPFSSRVQGIVAKVDEIVSYSQAGLDLSRRVHGLVQILLPAVAELGKSGAITKVVQGFRGIYALSFVLEIIDLVKNIQKIHHARVKLNKQKNKALSDQDIEKRVIVTSYDKVKQKYDGYFIKERRPRVKDEAKNAIVDGSLGIVGNIANMGDQIATVMMGAIYYIPALESASNWVTPLGGLAIALSSVGLVLKGIGFRRIYQYDQALKNEKGVKTENALFVAIMHLAAVKGKLTRVIGMKDQQHFFTLMGRVSDKSFKAEQNIDGITLTQKDFVDSAQYLRKRQIALMTIGGLAHIISILAVAALYFQADLEALGYMNIEEIGWSMLIASSGIGIGCVLFKKITIFDSTKKLLMLQDEKMWNKEVAKVQHV